MVSSSRERYGSKTVYNDEADYLRDQSAGNQGEEVLLCMSLEGIDKGCELASVHKDWQGRETDAHLPILGDERDHEAGGQVAGSGQRQGHERGGFLRNEFP